MKKIHRRDAARLSSPKSESAETDAEKSIEVGFARTGFVRILGRFGAVIVGAFSLWVGGRALAAPVDPYADFVHNYSPGSLTESPPSSGSFFDDPSQALGAPDSAARPTVPSGLVVQLGQAGSITLGFNEPIVNKIAGQIAPNPLGVDFVVFGNAFEQGAVGSNVFYREPGFVEVAKKNPDGSPGTFYLLLPDVLPSALVGGTDTGPGASLPVGYADVHPVDGSGNHLISPEQPGSAGGDGFYLEKAVLESSPGVPLLNGLGQVQFVLLDHVDFVRITDALPADGHPILGGFTTDIDAVVALPAPEPTVVGMLISAAAMIALRRGRRVG